MGIASIMLVDDEVPFVETMTKRLTRREFDVQTAFSGEACIAALDKDHDIEVVILDVKMPGMDGIETLKQIKLRYPLLEVIMLTGHATVESAIDGMKLGAFDYLMKPCDMDQLIGKVTQAARLKREHEERIVQARVQAITKRQA